MTTQVPIDLAAFIATGDISSWTNEQKRSYYLELCESLGLNSLTRPIEYLRLKGRKGRDGDPDEPDREIVYLNKDGAAQLSRNHHISMRIIEKGIDDGIYFVIVEATAPDCRTVEELGAVALVFEGRNGAWELHGQQRANAMMTAITKAKRRALLSICGLGMLDETEVATIANAVPAQIPESARVVYEQHGNDVKIDGQLIPDPEAPGHREENTSVGEMRRAERIREQTANGIKGTDFRAELLRLAHDQRISDRDIPARLGLPELKWREFPANESWEFWYEAFKRIPEAE